jgi:hypothetical protein
MIPPSTCLRPKFCLYVFFNVTLICLRTEQEVLGRINRLFSFDMILTASRSSSIVSCVVLPRERVYRPVA